MPLTRSQGNLVVLGVATMLNRIAAPLIVLVGGLVGLTLAPDPALATLPVALHVVGIGASAYPAASIMRRIGRSAGFALASLMAALAAVGAAVSIVFESFAGMCAAAALLGANQAFVHQYRFAAAENVTRARVSQAVSMLLLVSLVSAFVGPELGRHGRDWVAGAPFAGAFIALCGIHLLAALLLLFYREAAGTGPTSDGDGAERPLRRILAQPVYVVSVAAAAIAFAVMSMMMTAAPIAMHVHHGHPMDHTAWAIEGHILAMYLPSLFSGHLIVRFGAYPIMTAGVLSLAAAAFTALLGESAAHFMISLAALGVGWNFLFTAGSTLITTTYRHSERFKAQGLNDVIVFGSMATLTLAAGVLLEFVSWKGLLWCMMPPLVLMMALILLLPRWRSASAPVAG